MVQHRAHPAESETGHPADEKVPPGTIATLLGPRGEVVATAGAFELPPETRRAAALDRLDIEVQNHTTIPAEDRSGHERGTLLRHLCDERGYRVEIITVGDPGV